MKLDRTYKRRRRPFQSKRTSFQKVVVSLIIGVMSIFFFTATLTTLGSGYSPTSASVNDMSNHISVEALVYLMGNENRYFQQTLPDSYEKPTITPIIFEMATNLNPDDPRSLLARELPGFSLFDGRIVTAGEGVDYTNMPIESAPPMEVLLAEREASTERLDELDELKESFSEYKDTEDLPVSVHIVHTHNRESFLPELQNTTEPFHESVNVTLVGERLGLELAKRGINALVDTTDVGEKLNERNWQYRQSYDMSREIVNEAAEQHSDIEFFFDLHRDSQPREITTVEMNGEIYAKPLFVIGEKNPNYHQNEQLAKELHQRFEEEYYGLSRGIFAPPSTGSGTNGMYNQDLSENAILIEFGGIDNTLEEVYRTVELFADIFSEFFHEKRELESNERGG